MRVQTAGIRVRVLDHDLEHFAEACWECARDGIEAGVGEGAVAGVGGEFDAVVFVE